MVTACADDSSSSISTDASTSADAPTSADGTVVPSGPDSDGDGSPDNVDPDDDNDGQNDADEESCGSDPLDASSLSADLDGDGRPDCVDEDDDGDGQSDADEESCGSDSQSAASRSDDGDADGIPDCVDPFENTTDWPTGAFVTWPTASWPEQMASLTLAPAAVTGTVTLQDAGGHPVITKTRITLGQQNAPEHANMPGYIASGKSICCENQERVPFRTYTAACATDTAEPRMYVSMTLQVDDSSSIYYRPDSPRIGSIFETKLNPATGALEPTGNQAFLPICNESHGIAVSDDCSTVAVLCAPSREEPFSQGYEGNVTDLTGTPDQESDTSEIVQPNNLGYEDFTGADQYAGEVWLLEWNTADPVAAPIAFASQEPDQLVIHRSFGGQPVGSAHDLVYNPGDNTYGTAFPASTFKSTGKRHTSAALMVVDRDSTNAKAIDGWQLNPDDRGFPWECGFGHVFHARVFWNPYTHNKHLSELSGTDVFGAYGALCTTDNNKYGVTHGGNVAIKYEDQSTWLAGWTHYIVPSHASTVTGGAGHIMMPVDADVTLGLVTAIDLMPENWPWFDAKLEEIATSDWAVDNGYSPLEACTLWDDSSFCGGNMAYEWEYDPDVSGGYPVFFRDAEPHGEDDSMSSDWRSSGVMDRNDLNQIGLFKTNSEQGYGGDYSWEDGGKMKWLAKDDDCALSAPQMVDLHNGRYLVGYAKFQCISDGHEFWRHAYQGKNIFEEAMRIPKAYYLMEIDKDGNVLVPPFEVEAGWGGADKLVSFGVGKAAWLYIQNPTIGPDGTFAAPEQKQWELMVYESPFDG